MANARSPFGDGCCDGTRKSVHADSTGALYRFALHRTPEAVAWPGVREAAGNLGSVADPPAANGQKVHRQRGAIEAGRRGAACVRPRTESGGMALESVENVELCNKPCMDLEELHGELHVAIARIRQHPGLILSFFEGARLSLDELYF